MLRYESQFYAVRLSEARLVGEKSIVPPPLTCIRLPAGSGSRTSGELGEGEDGDGRAWLLTLDLHREPVTGRGRDPVTGEAALLAPARPGHLATHR